MASTQPTQKCPCSPPCAFISSCPQAGALTSDLKELKLSEVGATTTTTSASPKTTKIIHSFPDQYTAVTAEVPYYQNPASSSATSTPGPQTKITDLEVKLNNIQKKEKYLIDTYTEVFDMLEVKYRGLERVLKWEAKNAFEEGVVMAVMASIRDCMERNELAMENRRRALWGQDFEKSDVEDGDVDVEAKSLKGQENVGAGNQGEKGQAEVVKDKVKGEQEWEQV